MSNHNENPAEKHVGYNADEHERIHGERIIVRDFFGKICMSAWITAKGDFHTDEGLVKKEDLANEILRRTAHPAYKV